MSTDGFERLGNYEDSKISVINERDFLEDGVGTNGVVGFGPLWMSMKSRVEVPWRSWEPVPP